EMEGRTIDEVLSQRETDRLAPLYHQALQGKTLTLEYPINEHIFAVQIMPIVDDADHIFAGMVVIHDVTAIKRNEEALRASEARNRAILRAIPDLIFVLDKNGNYV